MGLSGFPIEEYHMNVFDELGFTRATCKSCGSPFWSLDGDTEVCGEAPCIEYSFIGKPIGRRVSDVSEVRSSFLTFFESRGHTILEPYPVVSRWRNDLYLTDASIVDFQPYVTNGIIPPPANPLVISQPCIRLVDIDRVGSTLGRYLSMFEMGGHHAFNYPDKEVYWKDSTVRYSIEYFGKSLGFPVQLLKFKESVWAGGGNAGPCFEVISGGLEVATLVFMKYKTSPTGELVELPIRTVDTGYGIERILWPLTGAATPFSILHMPVFDWLTQLVGLDYDERTLNQYARKIALFNPKKHHISSFRHKVLTDLGLSVDVYAPRIEALENIIRALDHSKSLVFILSEGVVPSNVGVGYLARLLARKTMRVLRSLGHEEAFIELTERELKLWGHEFGSLTESEDEVLTLVDVEARKYGETFEKGRKLVERLLSSGGPEAFNREAFVTLYDSHGLTPDDVVNFAQGKSVVLKPPDDFYSTVATRHSRELVSPPQGPTAETLPGLENLPPTRKLYYESPDLLSHKATVLAIVSKDSLVLDATIFYPEGGGQPSDQGYLLFDGQRYDVKEAVSYGNVIAHKLTGAFIGELGSEVECFIDERRRWLLRRAHTSTHIVNWAARQNLGKHVWQHGAQKGEVESRLDITHYANLTDDEARRIEKTANELVMKDIPVRIELLDRTTAEKRYGFRIYQGGVVPSKQIRIVSVGEYETEACGGLHLNSTGQTGLIKITGVDKIQDGVVRIIFRAGLAAIEHMQEAETILKEASDIAKTDWKSLPFYIEDVRRRMDELTSTVENYRELEIKSLADKLVLELHEVRDFKMATYIDERHDILSLIKAGQYVVEREPKAVMIMFSTSGGKTEYTAMAGQAAISSGFDAGTFVKALASSLQGGGGGKPSFGRGGVQRVYLGEELLRISSKVLDELRKGDRG